MQSEYEEIKSYYPVFYHDVAEMEALFRCYGKISDKLFQGKKLLIETQSFLKMEERMCSRLEKFFWIEKNKVLSLDSRRKALQLLISGNGKMKASTIKDMISVYSDALVEIKFTNYLEIKLSRSENESEFMPSILEILGEKLPAHIAYYLAIKLLTVQTEERFTGKLISCHKVRSDMILPYWRMISQGMIENQVKETIYLLTYTAKIEQQEQSISGVISRHKTPLLYGLGLLDGSFRLDGSRCLNARIPPFWSCMNRTTVKNTLCSLLNSQIYKGITLQKETFIHYILNKLGISHIEGWDGIVKISATVGCVAITIKNTIYSAIAITKNEINHKVIHKGQINLHTDAEITTAYKGVASLTEAFYTDLTVQQNMWRLNNQIRLNGTTRLNAREIRPASSCQ